ncbi:MAG: 2OG-Fe(II) oxygenase [Hyphomicrobiales bacterium]
MILDFDKLAATPLERDPYEHVVVERFVYPEQFSKVSADFPELPGPGLHPPSAVALKGAFASMLEEFYSDRFRDAIAQKFEVDLAGKPLMATIRGFTRARDGQMHTDSESKIITVLIYLNNSWEKEGGNLRLLRNGTDIENYAKEISPIEGTLLVFKRSDRSWHGHLPFEGPRRAIQLNWVTDRLTAFKENARHFMGSKLKAAQESLGARG